MNDNTGLLMITGFIIIILCYACYRAGRTERNQRRVEAEIKRSREEHAAKQPAQRAKATFIKHSREFQKWRLRTDKRIPPNESPFATGIILKMIEAQENFLEAKHLDPSKDLLLEELRELIAPNTKALR